VEIRLDYPGQMSVCAQNSGDAPLDSVAIRITSHTHGTEHLDWSSIVDLPPGEQRTAYIPTAELLPPPPEDQVAGHLLTVVVSGTSEGAEYTAEQDYPVEVYSDGTGRVV
jgi:hypothetical protein